MRWLGLILFWIIVLASVAGALMQMRQQRRDLRAIRTLERVDAFLAAWAEYGDWNPVLKASLMQILKDGRE